MTRRKPSKAQKVRDYIAQNPDASPIEIANALRAQRVRVDPRYVSQVKFYLKSDKVEAPASKATPASVTGRGQPWTFPKQTLEDAITIPKQIEERNQGKPMEAGVLAKAVGFHRSN